MFKAILTAGLLVMASSAWAAGDEAVERITQAVRAIAPGVKVDLVSPTPIPGLYEVVMGSQVVYFSADGRYVLQGDFTDLAARESLTENRRRDLRLAAVKAMPDKQQLIYKAKGPRKHTLWIFTDIDCGYCRKLHVHMEQMNALGIEVRYLLMPRSGVDTPSYFKAETVWCSRKPLEAMTAAKAGQELPRLQCPNPVKMHMELAEQLGVNATPTMITARGTLLPGYLPPDQLLARLQADAEPKKPGR